jgi:hypothetical protein
LNHAKSVSLTVAEIDKLDRMVNAAEVSPATKRQMQAVIQPATREMVANCLAILFALYGAARDPEIVAGVGLDLIMAEKPSVIAIQSTIMAMLRPCEPECVTDPETRTGFRLEQKPPRKFMPTWPELIDELRKQESRWQENARYALRERLNPNEEIPF